MRKLPTRFDSQLQLFLAYLLKKSEYSSLGNVPVIYFSIVVAMSKAMDKLVHEKTIFTAKNCSLYEASEAHVKPHGDIITAVNENEVLALRKMKDQI